MKRIIITAILLSLTTAAGASDILTGGWKKDVSRHPMLDTVSCSIILEKMAVPSPIISFLPDGDIMFGAVAKLYPGKLFAVRIDDNKALIGKERVMGEDAKTAIEQIKAGGKVIVLMVQQWPKGITEYATADLNGMTEQIDACQAIVKAQ